MLDIRQIRAARGLLDWTQEVLAERSGIARATIKNIENNVTVPRLETSNALQRAFEEAGVEFMPGSGLRMRDRMVHTYEGQEASMLLLNDVYNTLKDIGGEVLIAHCDEIQFTKLVSVEQLTNHLDRLAKANVKERLLIRKGDEIYAPLEAYRYIAEEYFAPYPFFIYGPKLALVSYQPPAKVIIINDQRFADAARKLFNFIWDRTEMPSRKDVKSPASV